MRCPVLEGSNTKSSLYPTFKWSTSRGYDFLLRKYLMPIFGDCGLAEINRQMIQGLVAQYEKESGPQIRLFGKELFE